MNITTEFQICEAKSLAPLDAREELIDEVWRGLPKRPRSLVPWMLYDAEGSRLFECITTLPEYYPTRTERDILESYAEAIITATGSDYSRPLRLLELGAGTAAKTGILLKAATRLRNEVIYFPVDVSPDALEVACDSIGWLLPDVQLQPMVANYVTHPPKRSGSLPPAEVPFTGTCSTAAGYIPRSRPGTAWTSSSGTAGSGRQAPTRVIRVTRRFLAPWANITASLCRAK